MAGRKLFLTHAGELAHHLVCAIARDAMAMKFVRGYAERHDRRKVVANLERLREMERTISREALLLIGAEVRRLLPRAFGLSRNPRPGELALCDGFYAEFLEALGRALEWPFAEAGRSPGVSVRTWRSMPRWRERNPAVATGAQIIRRRQPVPGSLRDLARFRNDGTGSALRGGVSVGSLAVGNPYFWPTRTPCSSP